MKNKETRLSHKLDTIFWWILRLLPLVSYVIYLLGASRSEALWTEVVNIGDPEVILVMSPQNFLSFLGLRPSSFLSSLFIDIFGFTGVFPLFDTGGNTFIFYYLAYCVSIEILRVVYNFFVFFIRWAYRAIENIGR